MLHICFFSFAAFASSFVSVVYVYVCGLETYSQTNKPNHTYKNIANESNYKHIPKHTRLYTDIFMETNNIYHTHTHTLTYMWLVILDNWFAAENCENWNSC